MIIGFTGCKAARNYFENSHAKITDETHFLLCSLFTQLCGALIHGDTPRRTLAFRANFGWHVEISVPRVYNLGS